MRVMFGRLAGRYFGLLLCVPLAAALVIAPASAIKIYANPSMQSANVSPDRTYTEGYAMQDVANLFMSKLTTRGFETRGSGWMDLGPACSDAVSWQANVFVAIHTNAGGGGSAHGTEGYYYQSSAGWNDPNDVRLADGCVHKCVEKFSAFGRGYDRGTYGDYPRLGWNLYVLANTPGMNSTLIEGLFHDNTDDVAVLKSAAGKDAYAQGLYEAVCDFYGWTYDAWNASYNSQSYAATMLPGTQATCWIEYKNTGAVPWANAGANPVHLGTFSPQDRASAFYTPGNWLGASRPANLDQANVAPGAVGRFTFTMTAPQAAASYQEYWKLVAENKMWFGTEIGCFRINVVNNKGNLKGTITNNFNGTPVSGATVTAAGKSTTTDLSGKYLFTFLDPGGATLSVTKSGYAAGSTPVTVSGGLETTANVALVPSDTTPPSIPTRLKAVATSGFQINLTWSGSTDNTGVIGYKVYRDGAYVASTALASYANINLIPTTLYTYRVTALDASGNESAPSDPASATTLPGMTAVFTDGFASLGNWAVQSGCNALQLDGGTNHGTYTGASGAKTVGLQTNLMYHSFSPAFSSGKFEGWFYDNGTGDGSRNGLNLRNYNGTATACAFYLGTMGTQAPKTVYWAGRCDGATWTWNSTNVNRSVGWHKLAIELLPYTGTQDAKYYIDGSLVYTGSRPAASDSYGIDRIYLGYTSSAGSDAWFDDIAFYAQAPDAPALDSPAATSPTSIHWAWTNNSVLTSGFRLMNENGVVTNSFAKTTFAYEQMGLVANSSYTRKVLAYNGTLNSFASDPATVYTLSVPPSALTVTCDQAVSTPTRGTSLNFTAENGFGPGAVQYYRWSFDKNPTTNWVGTEPVWNRDTLACVAPSDGNWYLHVQGYNGDDVANGSLDLGPFVVDTNAPGITGVAANPGTPNGGATLTWHTDEWASSQVDYGLTSAYGSSTTLDSDMVSDHSVTLSGLSAGKTYHFRVRSADAAGNEAFSSDSTFDTPAPKVFSSPVGFVKPGWNLISLPATPVNADPIAVLSGIDVPNASFQYWRNDGGGYQIYGETFGWTGPMVVGAAYWFLEAGEKTISYTGSESTGDREIIIPAHADAPYWIMIGHPFDHATLCSDVKFSSPSQTTPLSWFDAYTAGLVESVGQSFNAATGSFFSAGPEQSMPSRNRLEPWYGYWLMVRTTEPVTITVPVAPVAP